MLPHFVEPYWTTKGNKKPAKPYALRVFELSWTTSNNFVVGRRHTNHALQAT